MYMLSLRSSERLRFYAVLAAFSALVAVVVVLALNSDGSEAYGPWNSDATHPEYPGGNRCPDRPWLTGDPNVVDDPVESECTFRAGWACRTQEVNDEPVGELCMWADCVQCSC